MIGKSVPRVDAYEKVTGRAKFTDDLILNKCLVARVYHAKIGNGVVKTIDTSEAEALDGVVKVVTFKDVPNHCYPTPGHPWSVELAHQDVADRNLLTGRVRYYGDDIAAVVAEDEVTASRALKLIKVEYEEYPVVVSPKISMRGTEHPIHLDKKDNILARSSFAIGDVDSAMEKAAVKLKRSYKTPIVQHCHIENNISYAYMEKGRVVVVSSTQIPHIVRRIVGQALGIPWGQVRVIKPYVGGGFGNKQEVLYEPLNAFLTMQVGGRPVKIELTREETFTNTRTRHSIEYDMEAGVDEEGHLLKINERTHIEKHDGGTAYTEDDGKTWTMLPEGSTVSMNMWGFSASILKELKDRFPKFLDENLKVNPLKCEYFLPFVVDELLGEKRATVKVLKSMDKWYGVTYKEDKPVVVAAIQNLKDGGLYPQRLWEE